MKNSKRFQRLFQSLLASIILLTVAGFITSAAMKEQTRPAAKTCAQLYPATSTHNAAFEDPIDGGTCWACPKGSKRSTASVKASNACIKFTKAKNTGKYGCKAKFGANAFPDLGSCWTCPSGYIRTAEHVTSGKACAKDLIFGPFSKATKKGGPGCDSGKKDPINGGTCWTCPQGKRTVFAVNSAKACEVGVRAVKKGKAPDQLASVKKTVAKAGKTIDKAVGEFERKMKRVTQDFSNKNGKMMKTMSDLFNTLNGPKLRTYFAKNGQFEQDLKAKRYNRIRKTLLVHIKPHLDKMRSHQAEAVGHFSTFTIINFGVTGEASLGAGVGVEEGIYINFKTGEVGGYVEYGAMVGLTAGVASGVSVGLSSTKSQCGAGFNISAGFSIEPVGIGVGGGISLDPNFACKPGWENIVNVNNIHGISIGASVGVGPPLPVDVKATFTSVSEFSRDRSTGRLISECSECGGRGERPCGVTERYPSCDPGLAENCGKCS